MIIKTVQGKPRYVTTDNVIYWLMWSNWIDKFKSLLITYYKYLVKNIYWFHLVDDISFCLSQLDSWALQILIIKLKNS